MRTLLALAALVVLTGCWQPRQREALDLGEQTREVDATIASLQRLDAGVDTELAELSRVVDAIFAAPADTWAAPFPLDAYKHTAMSCLNAPFDESAPEPQVREAADRLGLRCAVAAALALEQELQAVDDRAGALTRLRQVDDVRRRRYELQTRLRQLPALLRRTRAFLASRRAEARQMTAELRAREGEYARKSFSDSLRAIEDYEARLNALEEELTVLDTVTGAWSTTLAEVVERLYIDLSRLGSPAAPP